MNLDIAVIVLAGGKGIRIGGGKPLRRLAGGTLLDHVLRQARAWSADVRVAVRDPRQVGEVGAPLVADDPAVIGPLGGLAAALRVARAADRAAVLTLPCDAPFLPDDLCRRLQDAIGGRMVAVAASGGQVHPVCALWRADALDRLPDYLATGRRSLRGFAEAAGQTVVEWPSVPIDPFFNVNSADDLDRAEALMRDRI
jgi:molybdopterin-guanine dinucleotide biosynthesis protein A